MKPPAKRYRGYEVVLDDRHKHGLSLRRAPPYLRFVLTGGDWKTLDALDHLSDEPKPVEQVIAAERGTQTPCHMLFQGKDKAKTGWYMLVAYTSVADQPADDVVRETERWRQWCRERQGASNADS